MKISNTIKDGNLNISSYLNQEWIELDLNIEDKNLLNFYKVLETIILSNHLNSKINLKKNSSLMKMNLSEKFIMESSDSATVSKIKQKVKKSEYISSIKEKIFLKNKKGFNSEDFLNKVINRKNKQISEDLVSIFKMYIFNNLFNKSTNRILKIRSEKYGIKNFITEKYEISKEYYACYIYYKNKNDKKSDLWLKKTKSFISIYIRELYFLAILTSAVVEDLVLTKEPMLIINNFEESLIEVLYGLTKNIKLSKLNKTLFVENIFDFLDRVEIVNCDFNNLIMAYDRLEKMSLSDLKDDCFVSSLIETISLEDLSLIYKPSLLRNNRLEITYPNIKNLDSDLNEIIKE